MYYALARQFRNKNLINIHVPMPPADCRVGEDTLYEAVKGTLRASLRYNIKIIVEQSSRYETLLKATHRPHSFHKIINDKPPGIIELAMSHEMVVESTLLARKEIKRRSDFKTGKGSLKAPTSL